MNLAILTLLLSSDKKIVHDFHSNRQQLHEYFENNPTCTMYYFADKMNLNLHCPNSYYFGRRSAVTFLCPDFPVGDQARYESVPVSCTEY